MGKRRKMSIILVVTAAVILILILLYELVVIQREVFYYKETNQALHNPMMGFAPPADNEEAVGDNTLVYVDVIWKDWEPAEGIFDVDSVIEENHLDKWRQLGKKVVLRFVCDKPGDKAHRDIPDWLYEKTGDGTDYDTDYGKGYSPNYNNPVFIEAHTSAIEALGEKFGQDSFVCYVELGSLGHWGEWHVKYDAGIDRIPKEEVCQKYIKPYIYAFPHAKILMRRPFEAVTDYGMGVYNDMTGAEKDTFEWLDWIKTGSIYEEAEEPLNLPAFPDIWDKEPVGGEFTSAITMENMLNTNRNKTIELLEQSHMTFIGPKCPNANQEAIQYPEGTELVLKKLGYNYSVKRCKLKYNSWTGNTTLTMTFNNSGTAPMYFDWPVYLYLIDDSQNIITKKPLNIKLSSFSQNVSKEITAEFNSKGLEGKKLSAGIGIEDPETGKPTVSLNMDSPNKDKVYRLY
jgi:hypothetical protein